MKKVIPPACALLVSLLVLGSIITARFLNWRPVPLLLQATSELVHATLQDKGLGRLLV